MPGIEIYVPGGRGQAEAWAEVEYLAIAAHPDDAEIAAFPGIWAAYKSGESSDPGKARGRGFGAVICTSGGGSPRGGAYAKVSPEQLTGIRAEEQKSAAEIGRYSVLALLNLTSAEVKGGNEEFKKRLHLILDSCRPRVIYTHNVFDRHPTHAAVVSAVIEVLRQRAHNYLPEHFYGGEVWGSLDWLPAKRKIVQDVSEGLELAGKLIRCFESQIASGKRYDEAVIGRWKSNATFHNSHELDTCEAACLAIDMSELLRRPALQTAEFAAEVGAEWLQEVRERLGRGVGGRS